MSGSLPKLIEFYQAQKIKNFERIALHDKGVQTLKEFDKQTKRIKEKFWKGQDLPFPLLLDSTGQTFKQWGIEYFPTHVLIDPQGRLTGLSSLEELKKILQKEEKK